MRGNTSIQALLVKFFYLHAMLFLWFLFQDDTVTDIMNASVFTVGGQAYVLLYHHWPTAKPDWLWRAKKTKSDWRKVEFPVNQTVTGKYHEWKYDPKD